jgi:succinate dehydrogenase / fumarate reductase flavoprotein subunit
MMQCLADGYFILPHTVTDYLADLPDECDAGNPVYDEAVRDAAERTEELIGIGGSTPPSVLHRRLGQVMLDKCGMARNEDGLKEALAEIAAIKEEYGSDLRVDGSGEELNQTLEYAGRLGDFIELAELMCRDAIERDESCGSHLREEHQSDEGEAVRDDRRYSHVQVWEHRGGDEEPALHREDLHFDVVEPTQRSYK